MEIKRRAAIYARGDAHTTVTQTQMAQLRQVAERMNLEVVEELIDASSSGAKSRYHKPGLDSLLRAVTQRDIDVVMTWSITHLGHSIHNLVAVLGDIHSADIDLYLHQEKIDTSTQSGKAMFEMIGVLAEFERETGRDVSVVALEEAYA